MAAMTGCRDFLLSERPLVDAPFAQKLAEINAPPPRGHGMRAASKWRPFGDPLVDEALYLSSLNRER